MCDPVDAGSLSAVVGTRITSDSIRGEPPVKAVMDDETQRRWLLVVTFALKSPLFIAFLRLGRMSTAATPCLLCQPLLVI